MCVYMNACVEFEHKAMARQDFWHKPKYLQCKDPHGRFTSITAAWSKRFPLFTPLYLNLTCLALSHCYTTVKRNKYIPLGCGFHPALVSGYSFLQMPGVYPNDGCKRFYSPLQHADTCNILVLKRRRSQWL